MPVHFADYQALRAPVCEIHYRLQRSQLWMYSIDTKMRIMGKRSAVVLPYVLCVVLLMVLMAVALWPHHGGENNEFQGQVREHTDRRLVKREEEDAASYSYYTGGAIYIRWGRLTCPEPDTSLIYSGAASGGYHSHAGTPANILCMPRLPTWGKHNDANFGTKGHQSYIYGVEYKPQTGDFPFSHENAETLLNHNVPCAVCMSKVRSTQLMVPGRKDCLPGWHLEYSGYLMAGDYQTAGSSHYVCVDKDPEADPAGYRLESSLNLVVVESQCGSLPCPPYVAGRELTCSVCTK